MRLLLLNPNTCDGLTDLMLRVARGAVSPGTEIDPVTAPRGLPYIDTRAAATLAGGMVLEMPADRAAGMDDVIITAFGDRAFRPRVRCCPCRSSAWRRRPC